MQYVRLDIPDVIFLEPERHSDDRGFFSETFNSRTYDAIGITGPFVQDNHSLSKEPYVVRGLHFQTSPYAQGKLVKVIRGSVLDVAVDIRHESPSFGKHVSAILSGQNGAQLWVPKGFAHAFCTLEPDTEVFYKVTDYYAPGAEAGLAWDDPSLGIEWPIPQGAPAILSEKDKRHPALSELPEYFIYDPVEGIKS